MNSITLKDVATASVNVYGGDRAPQMGPQWTQISVASDNSVGYYGKAWVNADTGEVIIANRGTVPTNLMNLGSDGLLSIWNFTRDAVDSFASAAIDAASSYLNPGISVSEVYTTGHSLGGSESQGQAYDLAMSGDFSGIHFTNVSIDAPGLGAITQNACTNITSYNFSAQGDVIHLAGGSDLDGTNDVSLPYGPPMLATAGLMPFGVGFVTALYAHSSELFLNSLVDTALGNSSMSEISKYTSAQILALFGLSQSQFELMTLQQQSEFLAATPSTARVFDEFGYDQFGFDDNGYNVYGRDKTGNIDPSIAAQGGRSNTRLYLDGSTETVNISQDGSLTVTDDFLDGAVSQDYINSSGLLISSSMQSSGQSVVTLYNYDTSSNNSLINAVTTVTASNGDQTILNHNSDGNTDRIETICIDPVTHSITDQISNFDPLNGEQTDTTTTITASNGDLTITHLNANGIADRVETIITTAGTEILTDQVCNNDPISGELVSTTTTITNPNGDQAVVTKNRDGITYEERTIITDPDTGITNNTIMTYDNGVKTGDTWEKSDGSHGSNSYSTDGSSSGTSYNQDGSYSSYTNDGQGNLTTQSFITNGVQTGDVWQTSDGSHGSNSYSPDGSSSGTSYNSDNSFSAYTNDGQGNLTTQSFNTNGVQTGDTWQNSDGSHGSNSYSPDGSSSGTNYNPDNSFSAYTNDGQGNLTTQSFNTNGVETGDVWRTSDGSHGSNSYSTDGSSSGTSYNADNSFSVYTNDGQGNLATQSFDTSGVQTGDSWQTSNGSHGSNSYSPEGSSSGTSYNADNSHSAYTNDGQGNLTTQSFNTNGVETGDSWQTSDGSHGSNIYNIDGSSTGTSYYSDNSYSAYTNDGQGNLNTQAFNKNGVETGDTWQTSDGSHGSNSYSPDGSSSGTSYNTDNSYSAYTNDGQGNVTTNDYNANGSKSGDSWHKTDGSHGSDSFNEDGSSTGTNFNPDNSHSTYSNDGQGDSTTTQYNTLGQLIHSCDTQNDGSFSEQSYTYDSHGQINSETSSGSNSPSVSTTYVNDYDDNGLKTGDTWQSSDGSSGTHTWAYDADGNKTGDTWQNSDGSHGSDTFNPDGSSSGTSFDADGSSRSYTNDGQGDTNTQQFSVDGTETGDSWTYSDGSSGHETYTYNTDGTTEVKRTDNYRDGSWDFDDDIETADGSSSNRWTSSDGSFQESSYDAATGESKQTSFDAWNEETSSYDYTVNPDGSTERKTSDTYSDGSQDIDDYISDDDGSFSDTWSSRDGSFGSSSYDAATGESKGTTSNSDGETAGVTSSYDNTVNPDGSFENKSSNTYSNGSKDTDDYKGAADGSFTELWSSRDGSFGNSSYDATTGESKGTSFYADGEISSYVNTANPDGSFENKKFDTYSDGTRYFDDKKSDADGSVSDIWSYSDGSFGSSSYNAATGESQGTTHSASTGETSSYDNTVNPDGSSESKSSKTYSDGTQTSDDSICAADGSVSEELKGSSYNASTGETSSYDNMINSDGSTESKTLDVYNNGDQYTDDYKSAGDGSFSESKSSSAANGDTTSSVLTKNADGSSEISSVASSGGCTKVCDEKFAVDGSYAWQITTTGNGATVTDTYANTVNPDGSYEVLTTHSSSEENGFDDKLVALNGSYVEHISASSSSGESDDTITYTVNSDGTSEKTESLSGTGGSGYNDWKFDAHGRKYYAMQTAYAADGELFYMWGFTQSDDGSYEEKEYQKNIDNGTWDSTDWQIAPDGSGIFSWASSDGTSGSEPTGVHFQDPVVLNLTGAQVHTSALSGSTVAFDMLASGQTEKTGWITPDEGFLVEDQNGDGTINSIAEMFSSKTSSTAATGFGALSELDTNHDGKFDNNDKDWSKLQIWVDSNGDGASQASELLTLDQLGITSISLNRTELDKQDNGNVILGDSTFSYANGGTGDVAEVLFQYADPASVRNGGLPAAAVAAPLTSGSFSSSLNQLIQAMATFHADSGSAPTVLTPQTAMQTGLNLANPLSMHR
jgi:hypothetical protein